MKQIPYIQWYIQDFLSSPDIQMMSTEEVGCYTLLLFNLYVNGGKLENNPEALSRLCRGTKISERVMKKFYIENNFLRNKRVDDELKKYTKLSRSQSENAKKRWNKANKEYMPSHSHRIKTAIPKVSQSESESESESFNKEKINKKEKFEKPENVSDQVWEDFLTHRKNKKAPITVTALHLIQLEAHKAGWELEDAMREMCARGWQGFKADWVLKEQAEKVNSINPLAWGGYG